MSAVVKSQTQTTPVTATLVEWALARDSACLPADVREAARRCVLDWMGVALAGSSDPLMRILIDAAQDEGGNAGQLHGSSNRGVGFRPVSA